MSILFKIISNKFLIAVVVILFTSLFAYGFWHIVKTPGGYVECGIAYTFLVIMTMAFGFTAVYTISSIVDKGEVSDFVITILAVVTIIYVISLLAISQQFPRC